MTARHRRKRRLNPRHALAIKDRRVLRVVAFCLLGLFTFGFTTAATAYFNLESNMQKLDLADYIDDGDRATPQSDNPEDPHAGKAINLLIVGSDVRDGENAKLGGNAEGMRSDTTMIMHVAADRSRAEVISIPRDSMVAIPSCNMGDGQHSYPQEAAMFNSAFSIGGDTGDTNAAAACTVKTIEENTGLRIDDVVVMDFQSVIVTVDALGGVPICIPQDIDSPKAKLKLSAGEQTLDGKEALGYVRARTGIGLGNGSDTDRIERQKHLMGAVVRHVLSQNLLTDSPALYRMLDGVTENIVTTMSIPGLVGLANSFQDVPAQNVMFFTVPWVEYPLDPNRIQWAPEADALWEALKNDEPIMEDELEDVESDESKDDKDSGEKDSDKDSQSDDTDADEGDTGGGPNPTHTGVPDVPSDEPDGDTWNPLTGADEYCE